jgi:hypothetical protein
MKVYEFIKHDLNSGDFSSDEVNAILNAVRTAKGWTNSWLNSEIDFDNPSWYSDFDNFYQSINY